jgi:hypothetical protein
MRLIRNTTSDGKCKYAIVRLDKLRKLNGGVPWDYYKQALHMLEKEGYLEYGQPGTEEECFVLKLKDHCTPFALFEYAKAAQKAGMPSDYVADVCELAERASNHPSRKMPD